MKEDHRRSVMKSISWRVLATLTTMSLVYFFTRKITLSLEIGFLEVITKMTLYYFHERMWGKIRWAKTAHPLEELPVKKELTEEDRAKIRSQLKEMGYID